MDVLDDLASALPRMEVYVKLFATSDIQLLKAPLIQLYAEIVRFGLLATGVFNRSLARNIWNSIRTSLHDEFQDCMKKIERASKEVDNVAQVEHMHQSNEEAKNQRRENEKAEKFREDARLFISQVRSSASNKATIPFRQGINDAPQYLLSSTFTGRVQELHAIEVTFQAPAASPTIFAIYGMSGLGKTQLALRYSTTSFANRYYTYIFWLQGSSTQRLHQSFTNILNLIDHPDRYLSDGDVRLTMARLWLERHEANNGDNSKWLLIVDDVSTSVMPFLRQHLPRANPNGRILLTTQSEVVAKALTNDPAHILQLEVPSSSDAADLFIDEAQRDTNEKVVMSKSEVEDLVKSVGRLPLAVAHAAGFMATSRMSLHDLVQLYRTDQKMEVRKEIFFAA